MALAQGATVDVAAQQLDRAALTLLSEVVSLDAGREFSGRVMARARDGDVSPRLLSRNAARISLSPRFAGDRRLQDAALRLLLAAAAADPGPGREAVAGMAKVTQLVDGDVDALNEALGYPAAEDPIRYLFARGPTFPSPDSGEYVVMTFRIGDGRVGLIERSTTPMFDLGPDVKRRVLDAEAAVPSASAGELASTRRYQLAALDPTIVAAKATRVALLSKAPRVALDAKIVAARALQSLSAAEGGRVAYTVLGHLSKLERELGSAGGADPFFHAVGEQFRDAITGMAFFARDFEYALERYERAARKADAPPDYRLWGEWGAALSLLAMGRDEQSHGRLVRVAAQVTPSEGSYHAMLGMLASVLRDEQFARRLEAANPSLDADITPNADERLARERDFLRVMATAGRFDLGARLCMLRIGEVRHAAGQPTARETYYLRELGAFARDLGYLISFRLGPRGDWEVRTAAGYPVQRDFLHNRTPDGDLTGAGAVVQHPTHPYGMVGPEEDIGSLAAAYGLAGVEAERTWLGRETPAVSDGTPPGVELTAWARSALQRREPAPSAIPYMKLAWYEWFATSFESLKRPGMGAPTFRYAALNRSGITSVEDVHAMSAREPASSTHRMQLLDFIEIREFLERYY